MSDDGFLSRWSRRKVQVQRGEVPLQGPPDPPPMPVPAPASATAVVAEAAPPVPPAPPADPPPTLEDAARLTPQSGDFARFIRPEVAPEVQHSALKTLFSDPHFNVMDGLDVYIDDYSVPDPLPPSMLRQMVQSRLLGLFDDEPDTRPAAPLPDENPDLRLQPDDAAGRAAPGAGPGEDAGREP